MHELTHRILANRQTGKPALLPYLMAGDGGFENTARLMALYENAQVTAIEIGIPFSDPVADGPVIQAAGMRALAESVTLPKVLSWLQGLPAPLVPRIVMSYLNPILHMGVEAFFHQAVKAGVSAVIIPDMPLEEMDLCAEAAFRSGVPLIPLASPQTGPKRLQSILEKTDGFIYAVTINGTTGSRNTFPEALRQRLSEMRQTTSLPVIAGFGISSLAQIAELKSCCDGFVIGSHLVQLAHQNDLEGIQSFLAEAGA